MSRWPYKPNELVWYATETGIWQGDKVSGYGWFIEYRENRTQVCIRTTAVSLAVSLGFYVSPERVCRVSKYIQLLKKSKTLLTAYDQS